MKRDDVSSGLWIALGSNLQVPVVSEDWQTDTGVHMQPGSNEGALVLAMLTTNLNTLMGMEANASVSALCCAIWGDLIDGFCCVCD
jgi:hypothetical protein